MGVMAERLARGHVREVDFDHRNRYRLDRVAERDRGVRVGTGVEDDTERVAGCSTRLVQPVDERALVVTLAELDDRAVRLGGLAARSFDICERGAAVYRR